MAVNATAGRDDHRAGHDLAVVADVHVGGVQPSRHDDRAGGFSGSGLYDRSARTVRFIAARLPRTRVLVATGGIDTVDRAFEMLQHADLIGGYTGLVLQGPRLFRRLADGVAERMRHLGVDSLAELREGNRPT